MVTVAHTTATFKRNVLVTTEASLSERNRSYLMALLHKRACVKANSGEKVQRQEKGEESHYRGGGEMEGMQSVA